MANTTANLSEVAVASMAAGILDDFHLSDLDEDTPIARFMAREFGYVRDEVLQMYPWHVAVTRASLPVLEDAPAFGWDYAYQLPEDCLRLHPLRYEGKFSGQDVPYELESNQILTNQSGPLYIKYTKRLTNMTRWRPLMARTLASRLAMYAATRVTGKLNYYEKAAAEFGRVYFEATHADSMERGLNERVLSYNTEADSLSVRGI